MIKCTWSQLKQAAVAKGLPIQWTQDDNSYIITLVDGSLQLQTVIPTLTISVGDQLDFETNFKFASTTNVPTSTSTGSGSISSVGASVIINTYDCSSLGLTVTGTWSATLNIYASVDGVNWFSWSGITPTGAIINSFGANGYGVIPCGGFTQIKITASAYTSGTVNLTWNSARGSNVLQVFNLTPSSLATESYLNDGIGNDITSTAITGTSSSKQAIDVNEVTPVTNYYSAPISIRQSAATASGAAVWTMRNASGSTKTVFIERIYLMMSFDAGTPLTRALLKYNLQKFSSATPTGGTAVTVAPMDTSNPATQVTDVRFLDTGLTLTGVSALPVFVTIGCPASDGATATYFREDVGIKLAPGEGLGITLGAAAVIGLDLTGEIVWSER